MMHQTKRPWPIVIGLVLWANIAVLANRPNVILVMTSNAGAQMMDRRSMGFTEQSNELDGAEELKKVREAPERDFVGANGGGFGGGGDC